MKRLVTLFLIACISPIFGQGLQTSAKYPLAAKIISVEMEQQQRVVNGVGGTSTWHLMKTEINGKTYGLVATDRPFRRPESWLHIGTYPARQTKNGFDLQFIDSGGKVRHEELQIVSEE